MSTESKMKLLIGALRNAEVALTNLAELRDLGDGPCEMLCGDEVCNECGCILDNRDEARAALKASGEPE